MGSCINDSYYQIRRANITTLLLYTHVQNRVAFPFSPVLGACRRFPRCWRWHACFFPSLRTCRVVFRDSFSLLLRPAFFLLFGTASGPFQRARRAFSRPSAKKQRRHCINVNGIMGATTRRPPPTSHITGASPSHHVILLEV